MSQFSEFRLVEILNKAAILFLTGFLKNKKMSDFNLQVRARTFPCNIVKSKSSL